MKKIEFNLKNLELVKGCPTDINGNGENDDDLNNDGNIDQGDQDYYDGYMDGYYWHDSDLFDPDAEHSVDYLNGHSDGGFDEHGDVRGLSGSEPGPDVDNPNGGPDSIGGY